MEARKVVYKVNGSNSTGPLGVEKKNAEEALRLAAQRIGEGWSNVTLVNMEDGHTLDAKRIIFALDRADWSNRNA